MSKTSRRAPQLSGMLRLVPLRPAHSRAPCAGRFRRSIREIFFGEISPQERENYTPMI